jgi:hypothetical protein
MAWTRYIGGMQTLFVAFVVFIAIPICLLGWACTSFLNWIGNPARGRHAGKNVSRFQILDQDGNVI